MLIQPRQANLPTRSVADLPALAALSVAGWGGSGVCYVETLRCYFFLGALTGALPFEVVTAAGGLYSWYRASAGTAWSTQATWYVDAGAGTDEGLGTVGDPLETWAEFMRRTGGVLLQNTTLTFLGDTTEDIVGTFTSSTPGTELLIKGTPTVLASGVVDVVSVPNTAANTRGSLTVTGIATFVGLEGRIIETTGANVLWNGVLAGNAGSAYVTWFARAATTGVPSMTLTPALGDAVSVIAPSLVGTIQIEARGLTVRARYLKSNSASSRQRAQFINVVGGYAFFEACQFAISSAALQTYFVGCTCPVGGTFVFLGVSRPMLYGGCSLVDGFFVSEQTAVFFQGFIFQGARVSFGAGSFSQPIAAQISNTQWLGVFGAPGGNGVTVSGTSSLTGQGLFGSGNGLSGLAVNGGATVSLSGTPTITGTSDITINGAANPSLPPALVAGGAVPAAQVVNWANWVNVAIFNRNVFDYTNGSRILGS